MICARCPKKQFLCLIGYPLVRVWAGTRAAWIQFCECSQAELKLLLGQDFAAVAHPGSMQFKAFVIFINRQETYNANGKKKGFMSSYQIHPHIILYLTLQVFSCISWKIHSYLHSLLVFFYGSFLTFAFFSVQIFLLHSYIK